MTPVDAKTIDTGCPWRSATRLTATHSDAQHSRRWSDTRPTPLPPRSGGGFVERTVGTSRHPPKGRVCHACHQSGEVVTSNLRHAIRVSDTVCYYSLTTADGEFVAGSSPDIFDRAGQPVTLAAELAAGSVVRVLVSDDGAMTAVQLVEAKFDNPFARCSHRVMVVLTGNLSGSPWPTRNPAIRHPLRLPGVIAIFAIETDAGKFFAQQQPSIFDKQGTPTALAAELGIGSVVRIVVAGGLMRAVQIVRAHLSNRFAGEPA
jgi:hypothetical protein